MENIASFLNHLALPPHRRSECWSSIYEGSLLSYPHGTESSGYDWQQFTSGSHGYLLADSKKFHGTSNELGARALC